MNRIKIIFVLSILLCFFKTFGQNPIPVLQKPFDSGIEAIKISPDRNHFITVEGDVKSIGGFDVKLWDYDSKIIINQHHFEGENGIGSGKIELLNNGDIILSKNQSLVRFNLLSKVSKELFKVKWPEFIHDYKFTEDYNVIVSTKVYSEKETDVYDITNQSSLYVVENEKIKTKKVFKFEIPTIQCNDKLKTIVIGNNKGEAHFFDFNLNETQEKLAFFKKKAISFIYLTDTGYVIANPALPFGKKGYSPDLKEGIFKILNINDASFLKTIKLPNQDAPEKDPNEFSFMDFNPTNIVKDIIVNNENIIISYGFSKLDFLNLTTFKLIEKGPKNVDYDIDEIYTNPDSDEILFSYGPVQMISNARNLAVYNTKFERSTFEFKEKAKVLEKTKFLKHINNQLYFTEIFKPDYKDKDSIVLQSPITKNIKTLTCESCSVKLNTRNNNWIITDYNYVFIGTPNNSFLKKPENKLNFEYDENNTKRLAQQKLFDTKNYLHLNNIDEKIYPEIIDYFNNSNTFLASLMKNYKDRYLGIINSDGSVKQLFAKKIDTHYSISNNGLYLAVAYRKGKIEVYNTTDWSLVQSFKFKAEYGITDIAFDDSSEYLYFQQPIVNNEGVETFGLFELNILEGINSLTQLYDDEYFNNFYIDRENHTLYINDGNFVKQINYKDAITLYQKPGSFAGRPSYYNKEIDKVIVDSGEYLSVIDKETNASAEVYFFPENHFIFITHEGYYMISPNFPLESFGFAINAKGYSFSQFDLLYNRPDKVLEFLGVSSIEELNLFNSAYKKRLKQQDINIDNISTNLSELPKSEITLSNSSFSTQQKNYIINASFSDINNALKTYNIWINGVPIYGSTGKIVSDNLNTLQIEEELILSKGNNKIEVSCINKKGLESLRKSVNVFYDTKKGKGDLIFVGIGVSKYQDSTYNLTYASKDVKDMSSYINSLKPHYNSVDVITLLDNEVTTENVIAIKQRLKSTKIEDKVILFYAGHGLLDTNYDYYISTHNINFNKPIENGLAYKDLEGLLDNIPARQKLLLIDACHSGEVDKESISSIETDFDASHIKLGYRGSSAVNVKDKKTLNAFELMQNTFSDLRLGTGTTVISSSSGLEFAYEGEEWNNGVFTYALLEGLKTGNADKNNDSLISLSEIKTYVSKKVDILTKGKQKPNARALNLELDWSLF